MRLLTLRGSVIRLGAGTEGGSHRDNITPEPEGGGRGGGVMIDNLYAVHFRREVSPYQTKICQYKYMDVIKENRYSFFGPLIFTLSFFVFASVIQCQVSASIDIGRRSRSPVTEPGPVSALTVRAGQLRAHPETDRYFPSSAELRRAQTQRYCVKTCVSN